MTRIGHQTWSIKCAHCRRDVHVHTPTLARSTDYVCKDCRPLLEDELEKIAKKQREERLARHGFAMPEGSR